MEHAIYRTKCCQARPRGFMCVPRHIGTTITCKGCWEKDILIRLDYEEEPGPERVDSGSEEQ